MMFLFWVFSFKERNLRGLICVVNLVTARDGAAMLVIAGCGVSFST